MKILWLCQFPLNAIHHDGFKHSQLNFRQATWLRNLAFGLKQYFPEFQLHIITELGSISSDYFFEQDSIHFYLMKSGSSIPLTNKGFPNWLPIDALLNFPLSKKRIIPIIKSIFPDIIHAHGTETLYSIIAEEAGFPYLISIQGIISEIIKNDFHFRYKIISRLEKNTIAKGRFFIAKTVFAKQFIYNLNPKSQIFYIENPMHETYFNSERLFKQEKSIVFVGYITKSKGIEETIEAVSRISGIMLTIIGNGDANYIKYLKKRILDYGITDRISWLGFIDAKAIADVFKNSLMLVFPSYMENSPNVISEAMCTGLPIVATNVGGIPDMIENGRTGLLVPPKDVDSLTNAILTILNNPILKEKLSYEAKTEGFNRFHPSVVLPKTINAYETVIKKW